MAMASQGVAANSRLAQMQNFDLDTLEYIEYVPDHLVPLKLNESWAGRRLMEALSHLPPANLTGSLDMRFQQKQQQEREQRRSEMASGMHGSQDMLDKSATPTLAMVDELVSNPTIGNGKVRQMFVERRRGAGIDRGNPLKPITTPTPTTTTTTTSNSTIRNRTQKLAERTTKATATTTTTMRTTNGIAQRQTKNATPSFVKDFSSLSLQERATAYKQSDSNNNNNISSSSSSSTSGRLNKGTRLNPVVTRKSPTVAPRQPDSRLQSTQSVNSANNRNRLTGGVSGAGVGTSPMIKSTKKYTAPKTSVRPMATKSDEAPPQGMSKCRHCGRSFNNDRLAKHENVCQKTMTTRRKIFDASKQRIKGTESEKIMKKHGSMARVSSTYSSAAQVYGLTTGVKKNNWRKKHEDFIKTIRAAKKVQAHLASGGKLSDLPPPPPSENPDYIQCPHCQRRFNQAAAERHIPRCATMLHNKPKRKSNTKGPK